MKGATMLRNIPANLSPDLVKILLEMGHGDEILLADANFPGHHLHPTTVRADGLGIPDLLTSILTLMPLDRYSGYQVALMETVGDDPRPPVWDVYEQIWNEAEKDAGPVSVKTIERMAFYDYTPSVYAVVVTGETALYGNLILKKGVL
jgi:L-fucose isomerase/ rbsD or fucU transport associated protein